jgi:hypothetical protein
MSSSSTTEQSTAVIKNDDVESEQSAENEKSIPQIESYEQSVTEKENLLMTGFNKMSLNGNGLNNNLLETNNNLNLLNGQHAKDTTTSDLIIGDGNNVAATNGHDKNSIENTL